jgi:DNA processing protein
VSVVSGLARGVDTVAHLACVRSEARTLAVIGSGVDIIYPSENKGLADRIRDHGAILSEFVMGTKPDACNFPRRNRIISGMTLGTLVIETGIDGGAIITAGLALDQNREVFAVPSPIHENRPGGTNRLIREGKALLVETVDDILAELAPRLKDQIPSLTNGRSRPQQEMTLFEQNAYDALPDDERMHIDVLAERTSLTVSELLVHLLSLEFKGLVRQLPGKFFVRG